MPDTKYYLKVAGIDGEVKIKPYEGYIQLESMSWGTTSSNVVGPGGGRGKSPQPDLYTAMQSSRASPLLAQAAADGRRIPKMTLVGVRDGNEFMRIEFEEVRVAGFQMSSSQRGNPSIDQVTFTYQKREIRYADSKSRNDESEMKWDLGPPI